jgi:AraC-like DNA-binding protein
MNTVETEQPGLAIENYIDPAMVSRELEAIRKIEETIAYMLRHLNRPLQVSTLAAQVNISQSQFFTLFKRHVGSTPMDYFIRLRLRIACHLLENTEMSVKAIAYTLGYNDPYYFSRIFKSFNRIAPSKHRLLKIGDRQLSGCRRPVLYSYTPLHNYVVTHHSQSVVPWQ